MADPRNFILDSDYPMDKIVWCNYKTYLMSGSELGDDYAHGLSFRPLVLGFWSLDEDFTSSFSINDSYSIGSGDVSVMVRSTETQIKAYVLNYSGTPRTIYVRLFAFEPSDGENVMAGTANSAQTWLKNSDYNYLKLAKSGYADRVQGTVTVAHNLGFVPQALVWDEYQVVGGDIETSFFDSSTLGTESVTIDEQNLYIERQYAPTYFSRVHYRIYADEA